MDLGSPNMVRAWTWMTPTSTLKVRAIGQKSRSPGQKNITSVLFDRFTWSWSHGSGSQVTWVKLKGHMVQGKRSHGSRST